MAELTVGVKGMKLRIKGFIAFILCWVLLAGLYLPLPAKGLTFSTYTNSSQSYLSSAQYIAGDINDDKVVNNKDLIRFLKFLSGWTVDVNEPILDVNGDGKINNKDLLRLFKFLSNWNVEIFPQIVAEEASFCAYDSLTYNQKGIYNILDENINTLNKGHISLIDYYNSETFDSDIKVAFAAVLNDRPEYFWIPRTPYSYGTVTLGNKILEAYVSFADASNPEKGLYGVTASEKEEMQAALNAKITEIVNAAKGLSTDFEKELFVHDYICQHTSYDYYAEKVGISVAGSLPWTVYGALINGNCVCEGYSRAMQLICARLGINCGLATGKGFTSKDEQGNDIWEDHMWNIIELDGEIYYLDVTWDDGLETTLSEYGLLTKNIHAYFNLTKAKIQLDHIFAPEFSKEKIYGEKDMFTFFIYDGDSTVYNYHLYTGAYIGDEDDIVSAAQFIMDCYLKGTTEFVIQFDTNVNIENAYINMYFYLYSELQDIGCDFEGIGVVENMFFCRLVSE